MVPPFSAFLIPFCCSCSSVSFKSHGNTGPCVPIPSVPSEGTDAKAPPCMSKWHPSDSAFLLQENRGGGGMVSCKSSPFCSGGQPGVRVSPMRATSAGASPGARLSSNFHGLGGLWPNRISPGPWCLGAAVHLCCPCLEVLRAHDNGCPQGRVLGLCSCPHVPLGLRRGCPAHRAKPGGVAARGSPGVESQPQCPHCPLLCLPGPGPISVDLLFFL